MVAPIITTETIVRNVIMLVSGRADFAPDATTESLRIDSLDLAEIMILLEGEFAIKIPEYAEADIVTVADIVAAVEKYSEKRNTP